jgi:hypothetical protein
LFFLLFPASAPESTAPTRAAQEEGEKKYFRVFENKYNKTAVTAATQQRWWHTVTSKRGDDDDGEAISTNDGTIRTSKKNSNATENKRKRESKK